MHNVLKDNDEKIEKIFEKLDLNGENDKFFDYFIKRIALFPSQCIRYVFHLSRDIVLGRNIDEEDDFGLYF